MTPLPSIRGRLLRALLIIGVVWCVATMLAVGLVVRHEVDEVLDHGLQEAAEIIHGVLSFNQASLPQSGGGSLPAPVHSEMLVWQLVGPSGVVDLKSHRAPELRISNLTTGGYSRSDLWRVYAMPFDTQGRMLYVAQTGQERREARLEAILFAIGAALAVGVVAVIWLRVSTRSELVPIDELARAVRHHDPIAFGSALPPPMRAELWPMHAAITDLGRRLAKRIGREQAFAAHAAHALRTPLATVIANLAVAQRRATDEKDRQFLQRSREAANRLHRVVAALLTMFRSGGEPTMQRVDVAELVDQLPFDSLSVTTEANSSVVADPDLLAAALMNLMDNAQRHGASMVSVQVMSAGPSHLEIVMRDNGTGIRDDELQRLQMAMDAEDYDGKTGLGLMLADLVARAHGGRCRLLSTGNGFTIALSLSAFPADRAA